MLKNMTNHIYRSKFAVDTIIGGTDKELYKTGYQSKLNVSTDANWVTSDCLLKFDTRFSSR